METPDKARGYVFYNNEWWEVLSEEGTDKAPKLRLTFAGITQTVALSVLGFHKPHGVLNGKRRAKRRKTT